MKRVQRAVALCGERKEEKKIFYYKTLPTNFLRQIKLVI